MWMIITKVFEQIDQVTDDGDMPKVRKQLYGNKFNKIMKLLFLVNILFLNCVFGQDKGIENEDLFRFFTKKSFDCGCTNKKTKHKNIVVEEKIVLLNNQKMLQIVIEKLSNQKDTVLVSKQGNQFIIYDLKSFKNKVFIDFDAESDVPIIFWSSSIFGIGSYLVKFGHIKDEQYLISTTFEGVEVDAKIIYQVDFNKNKEIYRFYYFDGKSGFVCQ